jgi:hypothetical protein
MVGSYLVGTASPASDYLRAFPHWLAEECPALRRMCVLYSAGGTFGWPVARGILESVLVVTGQSVELVPVLAHIADGVLGPSWEPCVTFPNVTGPASDWFLDGFHRQFGHAPDYIAAGSFATGLVLTECVWRAASLDDEKLRSTASDLDCNTFYGRFRIDSRTGIQTGHRVLLIRWQGGHKVVLPSRSD